MTTTSDPSIMVIGPEVLVGPGVGVALPAAAAARLVRVVVDTDLHRPGMFELVFFDDTADALSVAGLRIGSVVQVKAAGLAETLSSALIHGEVTALEGRFENAMRFTVARGYDLGHRLQRARRTRTFVNMTDSDIAAQLAREAGITETSIESSPTTHSHLGQCDQTDWDFLGRRAREIGYDLGFTGRALTFRRAATVTSATSVTSAGERPVELTFAADLLAFRPRVTAGNLAGQAEVRVWDPLQAKVIASRKPVGATSAGLAGSAPAALAGIFESVAVPVAPSTPAVEEFGPPPGPAAHVLHDRPLAAGSAIAAAAEQTAEALAGHLGGTSAEADGEALGRASLRPGSVLSIAGVPEQFAGTWLATATRHVFDLDEGGYRTRFVASGRQDRSLLALTGARPEPARLPGVYCGIVTNNNDPLRLSRVKVMLPWLSPDYESDWASVVQLGAGRRSGAMFLPEVHDEVLIGFEFADPRRPYVLAGLVNQASGYQLGGPAIKATGPAGQVVRRGFVSGAGNRLVFHDELPPGDDKAPATASDITLGTGDGNLALEIDQTAGTVTLRCRPAEPGSRTSAGTLSIQCGAAGVVNIVTGAGGSVNIDGGGTLSLKAQESVTIESTGEVAIKGSRITLN